LTIEEFDGRRRSGSVLISKGWSGQGWSRLISEMRLACSSLKVGRGLKMDKPEMVMVGKRSFAEVVGATKRTEKKGSHHLKQTTGVGLIAGETPASEGRQVRVVSAVDKAHAGDDTAYTGDRRTSAEATKIIEDGSKNRRCRGSSPEPSVAVGVAR
jgi:hypothetical protein